MFFIYTLLYSIVMMILLPFEYSRRPKWLRQRWLRERFGFLNAERRTPDSKLIWIHAVSMGEVMASVPFIKELKARFPSLKIVLSTVTDTGQKVARERLADIADIIYMPFDLRFILRKAINKIRPNAFIDMETELWPNMFRVLNRAGIPILVMNGRISEKSFSKYKKINFFMKDVIRCVDMFCMQDSVYAERVKALGADEDKVKVTGNFKFDTRPSQNILGWTERLKGPVIIAGSTHGTEEDLIIDAYEKLKSDFPQLALIIAPRHPERFKEVEEIIRKRELKYVKRSEIAGNSSQQSAVSSQNKEDSGIIVLLDVIGELASTYGISDIAIIGGSFIKHGGQNPLEAAFWGKPVICGPHMENFPFIEDFYRQGGAVRSGADGLYDILKELLESPEKRKEMGEKARVSYNQKSGAVNRAIDILGHYIK